MGVGRLVSRRTGGATMSTHEPNYLLRIRKGMAADVALGVAATLVIALLVSFVQMGTLLQTVVSLPLLLFIPGYFVLAVLFPRTARPGSRAKRLDRFERVALSYGVSLGVVPLLALGLTLLSLDLTAGTVSLAVLCVVLGCVPLVVLRRAAVPDDQRYEGLGVTAFLTAGRTADGGTRSALAVNALLVLCVGIGVVATVGVIAAPPQDASYTELAVLTENGDGELVAGNYSAAVTEGRPLVLSVRNSGDATQQYSVVVQVQRLGDDGEVRERRQVRRLSQSVAPGESWRAPHEISPTLSGDRVRVAYLLYRGSPPETPTRANAAHSVHVWLDGADGS